MCHNNVPLHVQQSSERVCHELRRRGWELAHLVGRREPDEEDEEGGEKGKSAKWSILWIAPGDDGGTGCKSQVHVPGTTEPMENANADGGNLEDDGQPKEGNNRTGHIVLAEVLVLLFGSGKHKGKVQNVAVRFSDDWADWTVCQANDYSQVEGTEARIITLGDRSVRGELVMRDLQATAQELLPQDCKLPFEQLDRHIRRAILDSWQDDVVVEAMALKAYRTSVSGSHRLVAVIIALQCEGSDHSGPMILINVPRSGKRRRTKRLGVVYEGEWPISHHYAIIADPPDIAGLEKLLSV
jgi:hypothetical protein